MTIALAILNYYDHGTTRRDFRDLALALARRGHRVVILSRKWHAEMLPGIQHVRISASGITESGKLIAFGKKVRSYCRRHAVDVVVSFSRIPGVDFYYLGEHAMQQHGFHLAHLLTPDHWLQKILEWRLFLSSAKTKIFALAPHQIEVLTKKHRIAAERIELLPFGVPSESHRHSAEEIKKYRLALREKYAIGAGEKVFAMVGSGFYDKGVDRAITALSYLAGADLTACRLVVCGKGSISRMDALARHYNVRDRVVFVDGMSRPTVLSAADAALCLSRQEALESTPLEAISCGTPVAVTAANYFSDFVAQNGGIVLPEPFDVRALSRVLHQMIAEPEFLAAMQNRIAALDPDILYHRVDAMVKQIEAVADDLSH